uniref:Protein patched n=1 Tax=Cacopsylla melanoneura TaxID=428564 RepID=A0A8D9BH04_9HEMI
MVLSNQGKSDAAFESSSARSTSSCPSKYSSDVYIRPSYFDAAIALNQIDKGKAEGQRTALWFRSKLQRELFKLGKFLQRHAGKVIFVALLILATFCVGLKSHVVHSKIEDLWIEEGGQLEQEIRYSEASLGESNANTHQLIIQTPHREFSSNILNANALLTHMEVLKEAIDVEVNVFDIPWRLKDLCAKPTFPSFDLHFVDQIFENVVPCTIITPLDCFWEGSKLLGPDFNVPIPNLQDSIKWTSLNPQTLVQNMRNIIPPTTQFPFDMLEDHMKRAGINSGYQFKPCLDPHDPECPITAANKNSTTMLNIGAELTGGCYGFAANYMHWPENLIVGGANHSRTGHIQRAHSIQSVIQLMTARELYDLMIDNYRVHNIDWTPENAQLVLEKWQQTFSTEVKRAAMPHAHVYKVLPFSTASLNDILSQFSRVNWTKLIFGYLLMIIYVAMALVKYWDPVKSQAGVGILGCLLISFSILAGLGFCSMLGIPFNASTTQIVPFLALGLSVDDMFLITKTFAKYTSKNHFDSIKLNECTGIVLRKTGLSLILSSVCKAVAFFSASLIPIPALRVFNLQLAVLILFNMFVLLLVYPAIVSLDLRRSRAGKVDMLCCCCCIPTGRGNQWPCLEIVAVPKPSSQGKHSRRQRLRGDTPLPTIVSSQPPHSGVLAPPGASGAGNKAQSSECWVGSSTPSPPTKDQSLLSDDLLSSDDEDDDPIQRTGLCSSSGSASSFWKLKSYSEFSPRYLARQHARFLTRPGVKMLVVLAFLGVLGASIYAATHITEGTDLADLVPRHTPEQDFLRVQVRDFGFYTAYLVTEKGFDYPKHQKLLYEYHEAFMRVPNVVKNDDGGLPGNFWLAMFRDWLLGLQESFDKDYASGCITQERWYRNASESSILAYKLLVQTGRVENPVDKSLIRTNRLVTRDGIINPKAFYNYLSAWSTNDALSYGASQCSLRPEPKPWIHVTNDYELKIPKSSPLVYAQIPVSLNNLYTTKDITELIGQVRAICDEFESKGLPNYPSGIIFYFWQQFSQFKMVFFLALAVALVSILSIHTFIFLNIYCTLVILFMLVTMTLQLVLVMYTMGIKLNPMSCVLIVNGCGIYIHFISYICLSFLTCIGSRDRRVRLSIEHMVSVVLHAGIILLVSISLLAFSEFQFILRVFFYMLSGIVMVGMVNGLVFFPVLLSLIGPAGELIPLTHLNRISTPSPEPLARKPRHTNHRTPPPPPSNKKHRSNSAYSKNKGGGDPSSLTTISEEPSSWNSSQYSYNATPQQQGPTPASVRDSSGYMPSSNNNMPPNNAYNIQGVPSNGTGYMQSGPPTNTSYIPGGATNGASYMPGGTTNGAGYIQGGGANGAGYIQGGPGEYGGEHGAVTVEPEFVIHTTTCLHPQHMGTPGSTTLPSGGASTSDSQSTTSSTSSSGGNDLVNSFPHQVTTTVTASTKFKVQLHAPTPRR